MRDRASDLPIAFAAVSYSAGPVMILDRISLMLEPGAPTALIGPNGSGKTTLLKLAMGLIQPTSGRMTWGGRSGGPPVRRAFVFQKPAMLRRSAAANVAFALSAAERSADRATVNALLEQVGLGARASRPARRLSGGEQQRLALARALARNPEVLFLDEPTASLDPSGTKAVEDIIAEIAASGVKVVFSTHDLGQARRLAADIVFLVTGRIAEHAPVQQFFASPASAQGSAFLRGDLVI
ncbi:MULTISPECIES: ATP-binding cassette domain-containing protein [Rhodomicrobium]|uniref:ATP-binding cassette domain-containing protein n=1 Tax=Rhodomicrobium TaxID=1068 RepID=UPI000B4ADD41|nr:MULTISPECIES: ATP-binding cassette domain-containing protein [Rhodomicrobium]